VAVLANAVARMVWECGWYNTAYLHQRTDMILFNDYTAKAL
jgi:arsenite oxidase large subunit